MAQSDKNSLPIDTTFPVELANELAKREVYNKHHYRPNSYLHKWWARRCGTTFRLILKGLVADEAQREFLAPAGLQGKIILDPMMGGGTTLHEAIRLGANVIGADIDPIPVLQARATLTKIPLKKLEEAYRQFTGALQAELNQYFTVETPAGLEAPLRYMLYGSRRRCQCGPTLLVDSFRLKHSPHIHIDPESRTLRQGDLTLGGFDQLDPATRLAEKKVKRCPTCGDKYEMLKELPYSQRLQPLVTVANCPDKGLFYRPVSSGDLTLIELAAAAQCALNWDAGAFAIPAGPKSHDLHFRGIKSYLELFSPRQLLFLHHSRQQLTTFEPEIQLNLGLLLSTSLEFNAMLCGYKGANAQRPGAIRHVFAHHAYGFPYTVTENNPLYQPAGRKASGTLGQLFHDRIRRGRMWAAAPAERMPTGKGTQLIRIANELDEGVEVDDSTTLTKGSNRFLLHHGSSVKLPLPDKSVDYVVTDPPYFDSVQYGDLANFFRVWLRQFIPDAADWEYELGSSAVDPRDAAMHPDGAYEFATVLGGIFQECARVLRPEAGRLIFTYHHSKPAGWANLVLALDQAGFKLVNYYVVHSESPRSVHISGLRALTHDAILVLALDSPRSWPRPIWSPNPDSEHFTKSCAEMLGWSLQQESREEDQIQLWEDFIDS